MDAVFARNEVAVRVPLQYGTDVSVPAGTSEGDERRRRGGVERILAHGAEVNALAGVCFGAGAQDDCQDISTTPCGR